MSAKKVSIPEPRTTSVGILMIHAKGKLLRIVEKDVKHNLGAIPALVTFHKMLADSGDFVPEITEGQIKERKTMLWTYTSGDATIQVSVLLKEYTGVQCSYCGDETRTNELCPICSGAKVIQF